jgi:hypothetical protein
VNHAQRLHPGEVAQGFAEIHPGDDDALAAHKLVVCLVYLSRALNKAKGLPRRVPQSVERVKGGMQPLAAQFDFSVVDEFFPVFWDGATITQSFPYKMPCFHFFSPSSNAFFAISAAGLITTEPTSGCL